MRERTMDEILAEEIEGGAELKAMPDTQSPEGQGTEVIADDLGPRPAPAPWIRNVNSYIRRVDRRREERSEARQGKCCDQCRNPIEAKRSTRRFCSDLCRVRAHRLYADACG